MSIRAYSIGRNGMPERRDYTYRGIDRDTLTGWLTDDELAPYRDDSYMEPALRPCGTEAAYYRHIKRREDACSQCKEAHALIVAIRRSRKQKGLAA